MVQTKEEIKNDLRELQSQYEALIAEGSYKLAEQRLERIRRLKEKLKQMKDSMEILRLSGFQVDSCNKVFTEGSKDKDPSVKSLTYKGYTIRYRPSSGKYYISSGPGDTVSLKHIGKEYTNLNEAKYSISNNDEDPTFTKGTTKDKTKVVGQIGSVKIYYDDNDDMYYVNQGGSIFNNPGFKTKQEAINYVVKNNTKDDDATEHGSIEQYGKGTKTESMGLSKDPVLAQDAYQESYKNLKIVLGNESYKITSPDGRIVLEEGLKTGYSKNDLLAFAKRKVDQLKREMGDSLVKDGGPGSGIKGHRTPKKVEIEDYMSDDDGEVIYAMLSNGGMVDASKLLSNKPTKDADPKVAEAQAIINLCGGIF